MRICKGVVFVSLTTLLVLASGCRRMTTEYGKSSGRSGRTSLNGFGALRQTYENAGFQCRSATRLTNRVMRADTIVWTPQLLSQIDTEATRWFDRWLATGNKTLVYVVPDSGSEGDYYREAAKLAPPQQRMAYRKKLAKVINQQMTWRLARTEVQDSGWFDVEPSQGRQPIGRPSGDWATAMEPSAEDANSIAIELTVSESTESDGTAAATGNFFDDFVQTGPAQPTYPFPLDTEASTATVSLRPMLSTEVGQAMVTEITAQNWNNSKVIVVSGGSLLTNYAFSRQTNRRLADQLVASSLVSHDEELNAVFVSSCWSMLSVSDGKPGVPKATGMELLTVWPISLVTMHGVMLGLVIGLAVLPIFGRPRRVQVNRQRDFSDHLDAVAALMNKTGEEEFARQRIHEYRQRVLSES